jgi:hypothetical protein
METETRESPSRKQGEHENGHAEPPFNAAAKEKRERTGGSRRIAIRQEAIDNFQKTRAITGTATTNEKQKNPHSYQTKSGRGGGRAARD